MKEMFLFPILPKMAFAVFLIRHIAIASFVWTRSGLEYKEVGESSRDNPVARGKEKTSPKANRNDFTKAKETLCGVLFYCHAFGLFFFSLNVPEA